MPQAVEESGDILATGGLGQGSKQASFDGLVPASPLGHFDAGELRWLRATSARFFSSPSRAWPPHPNSSEWQAGGCRTFGPW